MKSLLRRIEKAEDLVGPADKEIPVLIIGLEYGETAPRLDEPVHEWLTYRAAYAEARQAGMPFIAVAPDPWAEYEMRHGLEPGMLTGHPLTGKVPFDELLAEATGQRAGNEAGKQPDDDET